MQRQNIRIRRKAFDHRLPDTATRGIVKTASRRETMISTAMVFVMVAIAALFFLAVDAVLHRGVQWLLGIAG